MRERNATSQDAIQAELGCGPLTCPTPPMTRTMLSSACPMTGGHPQ